MSTRRHPAAAARLAVALTGLAIAVSGCSTMSPTTITTPYAAADGTNAQLTGPDVGTVKFRNVLLVSEAKGKAGVLSGAVVTDAAQPVQIMLTVLDPQSQPIGQFRLTAKPNQLTQFSSADTAMQVDKVPTPPGSTLQVQARTQAGGVSFEVPVLAPQNQYSSLTPSASPTESPSESPSESPTGSASPGASATPTATGKTSKPTRSTRSSSPSPTS